jgi:hypothetical protein
MGRSKKEVITECGNDRRETGYYSTPPQVAEYLARRLIEINPSGKKVIDPCVGREELSRYFFHHGKDVVGIDINKFSEYSHCNFMQADFLRLYDNHKNPYIFTLNTFCPHGFDYWVANPPYNCHEVDYIKENKKNLKTLFGEIGVHNMYSMFLSAIIDMAKDGAAIGVITLDSFLTSKAHSALRSQIISETTVHDIILCPTDLFFDQGADVRTCIIVMTKGKSCSSKIRVLNRLTNKQDFYCHLEEGKFSEYSLDEILLDSNRDNLEFIIDVPETVKYLFRLDRVGELFRCVTGISTGNDKKYLSKERRNGFSVPFYKNPGSRKFYCRADAYIIDHFLEESRTVDTFMVRNINLLFNPGITCSSMGVEFSACYLPKNVTFGVNPNIICSEEDIWWLLAYMNSDLVKYIVRGILNRTNMVTSGYISRVPVPEFSASTKAKLDRLSRDAYGLAKNGEDFQEITIKINLEVNTAAAIDAATQDIIGAFCSNIVRRA